MVPCPQVGPFPQLFAVEVVAVHSRRAETHDGALAIEGRRGIAIPGLVPVFFLLGIGDVLLPEQLAIGAGKTKEAALCASRVGLGEENPVAPDNRGRIARIGQRHLPLDVFLFAPGQGDVLLLAEALPGRSAPGRPVRGERRRADDQKDEHCRESCHVVPFVVSWQYEPDASATGKRPPGWLPNPTCHRTPIVPLRLCSAPPHPGPSPASPARGGGAKPGVCSTFWSATSPRRFWRRSGRTGAYGCVCRCCGPSPEKLAPCG